MTTLTHATACMLVTAVSGADLEALALDVREVGDWTILTLPTDDAAGKARACLERDGWDALVLNRSSPTVAVRRDTASAPDEALSLPPEAIAAGGIIADFIDDLAVPITADTLTLGPLDTGVTFTLADGRLLFRVTPDGTPIVGDVLPDEFGDALLRALSYRADLEDTLDRFRALGIDADEAPRWVEQALRFAVTGATDEQLHASREVLISGRLTPERFAAMLGEAAA